MTGNVVMWTLDYENVGVGYVFTLVKMWLVIKQRKHCNASNQDLKLIG